MGIVGKLITAGADVTVICTCHLVRVKNEMKRLGHNKAYELLVKRENDLWQESSYWSLAMSGIGWSANPQCIFAKETYVPRE